MIWIRCCINLECFIFFSTRESFKYEWKNMHIFILNIYIFQHIKVEKSQSQWCCSLHLKKLRIIALLRLIRDSIFSTYALLSPKVTLSWTHQRHAIIHHAHSFKLFRVTKVMELTPQNIAKWFSECRLYAKIHISDKTSSRWFTYDIHFFARDSIYVCIV